MLQHVIGKHDSVSCITPYTLLHAFSGACVGLIGKALDVSEDQAVFWAVFFGAGWEVFEYWLSPAIGYWGVRNTANTACDIAVVVFFAMISFPLAPSWTPAYGVPVLLFVGFLTGWASQVKLYCPETKSVSAGSCQHGCLMQLKQLHASCGIGKKAGEYAAFQKQAALARCTNEYSFESWLPMPDDNLQQRVLLSPPHRMLAALCAVTIVSHAALDWQALPTNLISVLIGFACAQPSLKILCMEDFGSSRCEPVFTDMKCPFYRVWPQNSADQLRHKGRNNARRRFRVYCLPVRFALTAALLLAGPLLQDYNGQEIFASLFGAAFLFISVQLCREVYKVWWSREYLLVETAVSVILFALCSVQTACYAVSCILGVHWCVSVWISAYWPHLDARALPPKKPKVINLSSVSLQF